MIKGVNKQIVEINYTRDEYIEKAILILNPEKCRLPKELLNEKADAYMRALLPGSRRKRAWRSRLPLIASGALFLAAAAILAVCLFL